MPQIYTTQNMLMDFFIYLIFGYMLGVVAGWLVSPRDRGLAKLLGIAAVLILRFVIY